MGRQVWGKVVLSGRGRVGQGEGSVSPQSQEATGGFGLGWGGVGIRLGNAEIENVGWRIVGKC